MIVVIFYLTPIVAVIFFINCVVLAKKIKNGDPNTANQTGLGALLFGYLIFALMVSGLMSS